MNRFPVSNVTKRQCPAGVAAMKLLDDASLESSSVVANIAMNRERGVQGVNSYERELRLNPIGFLEDRLRDRGEASWLDLCCGCGKALIEAARRLSRTALCDRVVLQGVDLVDIFHQVPDGLDFVRLEAVSLHDWQSPQEYDLVTCVHGLHYIGDKLGLIERCATWLAQDGAFVANLDLDNLRSKDGKSMSRRLMKAFREHGLVYDGRKHLLSCTGPRSFSLGFTYLGADDKAGPNYTGQEAVSSHYEPEGRSPHLASPRCGRRRR